MLLFQAKGKYIHISYDKNSNIFGDTSSLTEDEQTALINQLYNSLSLKNIVNLLTEEYNKIGEIKVLDENGNLTTLC